MAPVGALSSESHQQNLLAQVKGESGACDTISAQHREGNFQLKWKCSEEYIYIKKQTKNYTGNGKHLKRLDSSG